MRPRKDIIEEFVKIRQHLEVEVFDKCMKELTIYCKEYAQERVVYLLQKITRTEIDKKFTEYFVDVKVKINKKEKRHD